MAKRYGLRKLAHGIQWEDDRRLFITVCTEHRKTVLANEGTHSSLMDSWHAADAWLVGKYMVMPDHLHFFATPVDESCDLKKWMTFWKSCCSKRMRAVRTLDPIRWQRDHWDTRLRSLESYTEKWDYVANNPVRKGLVKSNRDWPYQGTLNELRWD